MSLCGLAVGLADVVQQRPHHHRDRTLHLLDGLRGDREVVRQIAARERVQPPHGVEGVLVDRVHVIDVVLHAARAGLPFGHQRGQQAQVLHLLQARRVGAVARVGQKFDEATAGVGIGAQRLGVRGGALADELARAQRQRHVQLDRRREDPDHLGRLALEHRLVDRLQGAVADDEAFVTFRARAQ